MIEGHELGSSGVSPQWVMLGVALNPGTWAEEWAAGHRYLVVGSDRLGRASLETVMASIRVRGPDGYARAATSVPETTLKAKLDGYTLAFGATYTEALAHLMSEWNPDRPTEKAEPEYRELVGEEIPEHLRDDAPSWECDRCHRRTWARASAGRKDTLTQPDGQPCGGTFR